MLNVWRLDFNNGDGFVSLRLDVCACRATGTGQAHPTKANGLDNFINQVLRGSLSNLRRLSLTGWGKLGSEGAHLT